MTEIPEITTAKKMTTVLRYLKLGGEWEHKGHIIVWLDNHVTHTSASEVQYGIHGLAKKGVSIKGDVETPCYMGLGADFNAVVQMIDEIPDGDYLNMVVAVTVKESTIKHRR